MKGSNEGIYIIENGAKRKEKASSSRNVYDADFETAIASTEFGRFNFLLYMITIPAAFTTQFEVTVMSYTFAPAHCDLNLSLGNKGMLNAITYLGIISSAFFGGFLADKFGRRRICTLMYFITGCNVLLYSFSQSYPILVTLKYLGGVLVGAPYSALLPYLSEFHDARKRGRMSLLMGFINSLGNIILPIMAWLIFPQNVEIHLFNGYIVLHSWNIFLMVCATPGLLAGILFFFMPESPKFLMTAGDNDNALKVFRKVYSINTGLPEDSYPVKSLFDESTLRNPKETQESSKSKYQAFKEGCSHLLSVFLPPYTFNLILVLSVQFGIMCGMNTFRLWLPDLYATISDYQVIYPNKSASLCEMLDSRSISSQNSTSEENCEVALLNDSFYIRNVIVAAASMIAFAVAVVVINKVGKKILFIFVATSGGVCGVCIYFSDSITTIVTLSAMSQAFASVGILIVLGITVDLFPTTLRTMTVALCSSAGRFGSMLGNIIFPVLLIQGCFPPFFFVGATIFASAVLVVFLPRTDLKPLE